MLRNVFSRLSTLSRPISIETNTRVSLARDTDEFFDKANHLIEKSNYLRNFAIIHFYAKQYLVKEGDLIFTFKYLAAKNGDRIKFEKVLLFGNENITLVGRPLLNREMVNVEATVIEKAMNATQMGMRMKPRSHGFRRYYFQRFPISVLRINEVSAKPNLIISSSKE